MEIEVPGLGAFENGGKGREVTEAQEHAYVLQNHQAVKDGLGKDFKIEGTAIIGPNKVTEIVAALGIEEETQPTTEVVEEEGVDQ
jgi:hypothetical protein